jgi:hypothetical protein
MLCLPCVENTTSRSFGPDVNETLGEDFAVKTKILLSIAFLATASSLWAQTTAQIQRAELAIPFGAVPGKIILAGAHLVFVDEEKPAMSFVIAKTEVEDLAVQDRNVSMELRHSIHDRSGERSELSFRLADGDPRSLKRWFDSEGTSTVAAPALSVRNRVQAVPTQAAKHSVVAVPVDTVVRLQLSQGLSSRTAQKGDLFTAGVTAPVVVDNWVAIPQGSIVHGRVTDVSKAERRKNGSIAVEFHALELPNKERFDILGSLTSLEDKKGTDKQVEESEVEGKSTAKRNVVFIGGGAGAGAAVGALAGGGKGAGIGAAVGAGLGTLGALASKGNDVEVASGTPIAMSFDREVTIPISR